jgi:hypothetical protein
VLAPKVLLVTNVTLIKPVPGSGVFWESGPEFSLVRGLRLLQCPEPDDRYGNL